MKTKVKRVLLLVVGWLFIVFGIVGLFLPVLQGVLFIVVGLIILSSEYVWAHNLLAKLRRRFPKISQAGDAATAKASIWLRRLSRQRQPD
jgi:uncharacterized membrane protein YbaN (DUF454 family)